MEEVLFINKEGRQLYLPAKTGDNLGFERVSTFSPPELETNADTGKLTSDRESETEHATIVLYGVASNGYENLSAKEQQQIDLLIEHFESNGFKVITLPDAVDYIENFLKADGDLTEAAHEQLARLAKIVLADSIVDIEGQQEQTFTPPFAEVADKIQALVDGNDRLSKASKEQFSAHLAELKSFSQPTGESQSSINNPVEQTQPGKAGSVDADGKGE